ncbi:hypothetical protein MLD38_033306 [Melastoma candidum]|uniref:Uncharacterized protein n=1 Tax=Melastoma candidum TaxID=119954 RepID=A0ACB9M8E3_9MYRT|nr:hypothetical protein MLD38_033306 [Melastoma candidum]
MAVVDVSKTCLDSIGRVGELLKDSVLYLDSGCAECFQYIGAFPLLLDHGVRAVCSLEDLAPLGTVVNWTSKLQAGQEVTIMSSRLLSDAHRYILRCLSSHPGVRRCTIFTCISEIAHSACPDSPLGSDAFREYEALLVQDFEELVRKKDTDISNHAEATEFEGWPELTSVEDYASFEEASPTKRGGFENHIIGHRDAVGLKLVVSVRHFPCIVCPITPRAFILPSEGSVSEAYLSTFNENSLSQGLPPLSRGSSFDGEDSLPGAILTAHFLYHLATMMDLKLEIFSLGDLSKSIGKMLTDMSSLYDVGRRKKSAGLLIIDRTLDLLTPCCHGDSLMDRVFSSLPRKERFLASNTKSSKTQQKQGIGNIQRASLSVRIPLSEVLSTEDGKANDIRLLQGTNSFIIGWNSGSFSSSTVSSANIGSVIRNTEASSLASELCTGSLISTECFRGTPYIEALLDRRTKDGAVLVKKWLQETLRRENISTNVKVRPGLPSKSELLALIRVLVKSQTLLVRNKGLIQVAAATLEVLEESCSARWDAYSSAVKMLTVSAGDTSQSLAAQIGDLITKSALLGSPAQKNRKPDKSQSLLSFQDALLLTVVGYLLAGENFPTSGSDGPFSWQEDHLMKEAMVDAILENPDVGELKFLEGLKEELEAKRKGDSKEIKEESSKGMSNDGFDDDQWDSWGDEYAENKDQDYSDVQLKLELHDRVDNLFKFLHKLSSFKSKGYPLSEGLSPFDGNAVGAPSSNKCLLYRIITRILNKSKLHGLEYHSSTVGRFLKSGFGRLGLVQAKPQLSDQSVILVFVVGGVSPREIREIQEAVSESGRPDVEVILGGTTLLTPKDMFELLLGQYSYSS